MSGTAIMDTGPITDTGATITGHTGGIIQGTATGVTAITVVTAATTVRDRQTLRSASSFPLLL